MTDNIIINIDYDEGDQSTYRAVTVGDRRFETGDPVRDFANASKYANAHFEWVGLSSTCDSFVIDGDLYRWVEDSMLGEIITQNNNSAAMQWAQTNVIDTATAARLTGLAPKTIAQACRNGQIARAWKGCAESRVWLMFREELTAWRDRTRQYERKD